MKFPLLIVLTFVFSAVVAQEKIDSVSQNISAKVGKYNVDSLSAKLPQLPDSLLPSYQKVDSIRGEFNAKAKSLKASYDSTISSIDANRNKLTTKIDSLQNLKLPTGKFSAKLDSLDNKRSEAETKFNSKMADLKSKTTGKLNALDLPPQYKEPVQQLTKNVEGLVPGGQVPQLEVPGFQVPGSKFDISGSGFNVPGLDTDVSKYTNLPKIETPLGELGAVTKDLKGYQDDVKNITSGNLQDVKKIPKTIEEQAGKIDGVQELQKQSGVVDEMKGKLDPLKDPAAGKDKAVEMAKEVAIDHFAGKEEQLKNAMDQMSKYKQKYSSVSSIKDLPKRPPNAMKGKPFIERVVPGLYFQYQQKGFNLYDFNPYVGYRISGRFTAGVGWNQRYARDKKMGEWNANARIFGPRAFVDVRLGKGFIAHVESEYMDTFVHTDIKKQNFEEGNREWVWSVMTGMKRDYKIYKNLRGTVLIQYNLFNPKYKAPYVDRLNSRIGFEYVLKKRKKQS